MFEDFTEHRLPTGRGDVFARTAGAAHRCCCCTATRRPTSCGRITALAVLDIVPSGEVWARADASMALSYWHWGFLAQPAPLPERLIAADPDAFFDFHVRALGLGAAPGRYPPELMSTYRQLLDDPQIIQAICEDYRAPASIDHEQDDADRGRHRIGCPVLVLWSEHGALPRFYGDVLAVRQP